MANYATLKAAIEDVIKTNGNEEITGEILQNALIAMINALGTGYQFAGVATPATTPGTPDNNVVYIAGAGTYPNFGTTVVRFGEIGVFAYNGSWSYSTIKTGADAIKPAIAYFYNSEAGNITAKTVTAANYELMPGGCIKVQFANANTANSPTLNVNNTGAYPMYFNGGVVSPQNTWKVGETVLFYLDNYMTNKWMGVRLVDLPDFINVNVLIDDSTPFASATLARVSVPVNYRKSGLNITYLLADRWFIDQFTGDDISDWGTASNWITYGPISKSQISKTNLPLFDVNFVAGHLISSNGNYTETQTEGYYATEDYYDVSNAARLLCYMFGQGTGSSVCFYDIDKNKISNVRFELSDTPVLYAVDVPTNAIYARFSGYSTNSSAWSDVFIGVVLSCDKITKAIDKLNDSVEDIENSIYVEGMEDVINVSQIASSYINGYGDIIGAGPSFIIRVYEVTPGDTLQIYNNLHMGTALSYAFYNDDEYSSESCVEKGPKVTESEDIQRVIVPEGATYLLVQKYSTYECNVKKIVNVPLSQMVEGLEDEVKKLSDKEYSYTYDETNLFVAWNNGHGIEYTYWFKRCMANNLFTFYKVGYREVDRIYSQSSDIETDSSIILFNTTTSDNIGPLAMRDGGWVGGNHTYSDGGVKTAQTDNIMIIIDGVQLNNSASGYCKDIIVKVVNTIFDPAFEPETGDISLTVKLCDEYVTYAVRKNTIEVSCSHKFVSTTTNYINTYYGMQSMFVDENYIITPNGLYINWHTPVDSQAFNKEDYPNFNRFIEKNTVNSTYQSAFLRKYALGRHNDIANDDPIFRTGNTGKDYHVLIKRMADIAGKTTEWNGAYTFFNEPIADDANVFVYRGVLDGKDALYVNTKQTYSGTIPLPNDMLLKSHKVEENIGILDYDDSDVFNVGGAGLYIKSATTGSLILVFD